MENLLDWSVRDRQQYFFSLQGVLRIIEIILVIVTLGLARGGDGGFRVLADYIFIVVGTTMFLTITLLIYIVSTLMGDQPPVLLDSMTTMIGGILMITAGALTLSYSSKVSVRICWCGG